jgi:IMP dehydrogenase
MCFWNQGKHHATAPEGADVRRRPPGPRPFGDPPRDVSLATRLTRKIQLNLPLISAAMDTVTEARLAIALAQEGGIGIVHKNLNPKAQAAEVAKVKRFESGVLKDPITVPPTMTVREVLALTRNYRISGLPVVDNGVVVGIVTNRDTRFETNLDQAVRATS